MKNYTEIYVSLREEIMQAIDEMVDNILSKYDVECLADLENAPEFYVYIPKYVDDGLGNSKLGLSLVTITDIYVGDGECVGYGESMQLEPYSLCEIETESLIEIYAKLCKYL